MDDSPNLLALLKDNDCPCSACGYNLRGASRLACPECGMAFDSSSLLNRRGRIDPAWLTMVIAYAAALPWSVLYVWQRLIVRGRVHYGDDWNPVLDDYGRRLIDRPLPEAMRMLASSAWWLSVPLVVIALIACRRKIALWPRTMRWLVAGACVVAVLLAYRRWQWWYFATGLNGSQRSDWPWWYIR